MTPIAVALIGAGGMARRYLNGFAALAECGVPVMLAAICARVPARGEMVADAAATRLGYRPVVVADLASLRLACPGVAGAIVVTDAGSHHAVASACLEAGLHVLVEKPLAVTVRGCARVIAAAERAGRVLSVAENYRRDPMNRLVKALIVDGAIGTPRVLIEQRVGGGNALFISPWRHQKVSGTLVLDVGVHYADLFEYLLGPVATVHGEGRCFEPVRYPTPGSTGGTTANWSAFYGETAAAPVAATGEDALVASLSFASGAVGQWLFHHAAFCPPEHRRVIHGSAGTLICPNDRGGQPVRLFLAGNREVQGADILAYAPGYRLDPLAARLFGAARPWRYEAAGATVDGWLLALEVDEFARCIQTGQAPEVDGAAGRRAVALVNAVLEAGLAGRPLSVDEVERGAIDAYQREIDEEMGLVATGATGGTG